jgi:23S rRNA (cytidine1920-2'-O)/16S rRNA (cytidine1409-2'-O)-methyltransferase
MRVTKPDMEKQRLDVALVLQGVVPSREKARAAIMAGQVVVDGKVVDKPGTSVSSDSRILLKADPCPYVSRGGLKLAKALAEFKLDLAGKVVADVGASTGGFTDCALQHGARKVFAIDVGYGQLAWRLRQDPRVAVRERLNARHLSPADLGEPVDLATVDVAFISLEKIFPALRRILRADGEVVSLVKPQFEAGREKVGKRGVVRDPAIHRDVIAGVMAAAGANGFIVKGLSFSPLTGPEGNIEYLLWLGSGTGEAVSSEEPPDISKVVGEAHRVFAARREKSLA